MLLYGIKNMESNEKKDLQKIRASLEKFEERCERLEKITEEHQYLIKHLNEIVNNIFNNRR